MDLKKQISIPKWECSCVITALLETKSNLHVILRTMKTCKSPLLPGSGRTTSVRAGGRSQLGGPVASAAACPRPHCPSSQGLVICTRSQECKHLNEQFLSNHSHFWKTECNSYSLFKSYFLCTRTIESKVIIRWHVAPGV